MAPIRRQRGTASTGNHNALIFGPMCSAVDQLLQMTETWTKSVGDVEVTRQDSGAVKGTEHGHRGKQELPSRRSCAGLAVVQQTQS